MEVSATIKGRVIELELLLEDKIEFPVGTCNPFVIEVGRDKFEGSVLEYAIGDVIEDGVYDIDPEIGYAWAFAVVNAVNKIKGVLNEACAIHGEESLKNENLGKACEMYFANEMLQFFDIYTGLHLDFVVTQTGIAVIGAVAREAADDFVSKAAKYASTDPPDSLLIM